LKRAGEHGAETHAAKARTERPCLLLTKRGKRDIGAAGVLAGDRPRRLAVTNEVHEWQTC
jgi:hypothetical protein